MARSLFELGFVVAIVDHATAPLRAIERGFERITMAATRMRGLRDAGEGMKRTGMQFAIAGAVIGAAVYEMVEPAIKSQHEMKVLETQLHLTKKALEEIDRASIAFSNTQIGSEEEYKRIAGLMQRVTKETDDMTNTLASTATVMKLASQMGVDFDTASTLMIRTFSAMGNAAKPAGPQIKAIGDIIQATQRNFAGFKIESTLMGLGKIAPLATAMNVPFSELMTVLAGLQRLGPRAAMQFGSAMAAVFADTKKLQPLGITMKPGMGFFGVLEQVRAHTAGMSQMAKTSAIEKAFSGAGPLVLDLIRHLDEYRRAANTAQHSTDQLDIAVNKMRTEDASTAIKVLGNALHNTREIIGDTVIMLVGPFADALTKALVRVQEFAKAHPTLTRFSLLFAAVSAAVLVAAGIFLMFAGSSVLLLANLPAAITTIGVMTGWMWGLAASFWGATYASIAFLATNPVGWVILAVAALAGLVAAVKHFYPQMYDAGVGMLKALGRGILDTLANPIGAAEKAASKIADYFVGHSPPPVGPLRELANVRIMETIAERMSPAPVVAAARRAAGAISIHYAPTINNAGQQQGSLRTMLDEHFKQLASMLSDAQQRQERTAY